MFLELWSMLSWKYLQPSVYDPPLITEDSNSGFGIVVINENEYVLAAEQILF